MTKYYDAEKNTITVGISDFMQELGESTKGLNLWDYKTFKKTIKDLSDYSIIGIGLNGKERIIRLINSAEFPRQGERQIVTCYMSEDFREAMKLHVKGNTKIEFKIICSMTSRFTINLYNLLRSWQGRDKVTFHLDYLKELLNANAKSYENFAKFRQTVLDVAVDEINEKTTLDISYSALKKNNAQGNKIEKVTFHIKQKKKAALLPKAKQPFESIPNGSDIPNDPLKNDPAAKSLAEALEEIKRSLEELKANGLLTDDQLPMIRALTKTHFKESSQEDGEKMNDHSPITMSSDNQVYGYSKGSDEDPFFREEGSSHPPDEPKKELFTINPLKRRFDSKWEKESYIEKYLSQMELSNFCKATLIEIVPEDVHLYSADNLIAIEALLKVHIPLLEDISAPISWQRDYRETKMKNAILLYTTKEWSRYKANTKTTPFQHYTSNLGYWLQEKKDLF